jgi:hypothetical protein
VQADDREGRLVRKQEDSIMKHAIIAACGAFTVAGTLTLAAQTPPQAPRPAPSTPSTPTRSDDKTLTVVGCLKAWDATTGAPATGTATTPGTTAGAPASRFVLTNVEPDSKDATATTPSTSGTTGKTSMGTKQYVLTADTGVNLAAHLNHKVRITGKESTMAEHSAAGAATTTPRPSEPARPGEMPAPAPADPGRTAPGHDMAKAFTTVAVSSVTMISTTCTGATN